MTIRQKSDHKNDYVIVGASATGPLHLINATPCQDAFSYKVLPSGVGVISLADGLGSAFFSDFGARNAADTAVLTAEQHISDFIGSACDLKDIAMKAVYSARKVLEAKTQEYRCELRDLACTLIVVIMHKDSVAVAHVGDGAVVAKTTKGLRLISPPGDSEYTNEVTPITSIRWEKYLRVTPIISSILGIMAFTDGLQRAALKKTPQGLIPFAGFCDPLFNYVKEVINIKEAADDIKNLLSSKKVCENSEDDKTLIIATLIV
ncbi:MAG: PP2C family serine/threonine-protein phosphatase [Planctomycetota bacterium]|jgi:hypothetical protein